MSQQNHMPENSSSSTPPVSEATLHRMLALQEQRLAVELRNADISSQEIELNRSIAGKTIEAQAADLKDERQVEKSMRLHQLLFIFGVATLVMAFVLVALWMGKDILVLDIVKVVLGFLGGLGTSAFLNKRNSDQK
jgi:hypothetical protein